MNRIRYRDVGEGVLQSVQTFVHATNGAQYVVRISPDMWRVLDKNTEIVAVSGHITNRVKALKDIKKALKSLEISFASEKRIREKKAS